MWDKLDLAAIRARADAATPGPWKACCADRNGSCATGIIWAPDEEATVLARHDDAPHVPGEQIGRNAVFAANARTDVPALLDRVDELERELADARRCLIEAVPLGLKLDDGAKPTRFAITIEGAKLIEDRRQAEIERDAATDRATKAEAERDEQRRFDARMAREAAESKRLSSMEEVVNAAIVFVEDAVGGYGGNVWRFTQDGRALIAAVQAFTEAAEKAGGR